MILTVECSKVALLCVLLLTLSSCFKVQKKNDAVIDLDETDKQELVTICKKLNDEGNIMKLLKEIKEETDRVFDILDDGKMLEKKDELKMLSDSINKKAYLVTSISRPEWVIPQVEFTSAWVISPKDLKDLAGSKINGGLKLLNLKLSHLVFAGEKRSDLEDLVQIEKVSENEFKVSFRQNATALDMCQLNQTLMIVVELEYKNLLNTNNRFFNLFIENNF